MYDIITSTISMFYSKRQGEKMEFSDILKNYPYTTELHAHSYPVSACGDFSAEEVVKLYADAGVSSLVLTNHLTPSNCVEGVDYYLEDYRKAREAAMKESINVILGVELRFTENINDYLIYGVCEDDIKNFIELIPYGIENFYKQAKTERNVIIQAHPLRKNIVLAPVNSIDGIESLNMHPNHNAKISLATAYARDNSLLVTGGTDFHHPNHQALCLMRTNTKLEDSYDVANAIKSKAAVFDCSGHIIIPYIY